MASRTQILGIVNITADSFSDGGKFLTPAAAITHAQKLLADGADIIDLGPAASNPDAASVEPEMEIQRLEPVLQSLAASKAKISVDSFQSKTQLYAISRGVAFLNDIQGFSDPKIYPQLANSACKLIVMHSVQGRGKATRVDIPASQIMDKIQRFFHERIKQLVAGGISRDRLILDPGMGFFLGTQPESSLKVLAHLADIGKNFGLPIHVSVSRKSFLRKLTGREDAAQVGPATLAAELWSVMSGVDYIRTHDPAALRDGMKFLQAVQANQ